MGRVHLFEFGDQKWFPQRFKNYLTDFLEFGANLFDIYREIDTVILNGLMRSAAPNIIDMGSGGGGGWPKIISRLQKKSTLFQVTLTDFNPNIRAFEKLKSAFPKHVEFESRSVDARNVQPDLKGLRTMFLSFHHMRPHEAISILQNAIDQQQPIAIFEVQDRSVASTIAMLFSPITTLLFTPFIKPFDVWRIVFTYLIPILPLVILFDGLVSNLRTYHENELESLVQKTNNHESFEWEIGRKKKGPGFVLYLLAFPKTT